MKHLDGLENVPGVYQIECVATGESYVGGTTNLRIRIIQHFGELRRGVHFSKRMQELYATQGEDGFQVHVLLLCDAAEVLANERRLTLEVGATLNTNDIRLRATMPPRPAAPTRRPLGPMQQTVLSVIREYMEREKAPPTMQEIADILGLSKTTIFDHLGTLEKKGWITRDRLMTRSIQLTGGACPCCGQEIDRRETLLAQASA